MDLVTIEHCRADIEGLGRELLSKARPRVARELKQVCRLLQKRVVASQQFGNVVDPFGRVADAAARLEQKPTDDLARYDLKEALQFLAKILIDYRVRPGTGKLCFTVVRNLPEIRVSPLGGKQPRVLQLLIARRSAGAGRHVAEYVSSLSLALQRCRWTSHIVAMRRERSQPASPSWCASRKRPQRVLIKAFAIWMRWAHVISPRAPQCP